MPELFVIFRGLIWLINRLFLAALVAYPMALHSAFLHRERGRLDVSLFTTLLHHAPSKVTSVLVVFVIFGGLF